MSLRAGNSVLICESTPEKPQESNDSSSTSSIPEFNFGELQNLNPNNGEGVALTMGPGIYLIYCKPKNLFYIGHSSNTINRLGRHYDSLSVGKSDSALLQQDWDIYGSENFFFIPLAIGPEYDNRQTRESIEATLITLNKGKVYNQLGTGVPGPTRKVRVSYKSQSFDSIAEAAKVTKVSATQIKRLVKTPDTSGWKIIPDDPFDPTGILNSEKAKGVEIDGKPYLSIHAAAKAMKISRRTIVRRLNSNRYPTYKYLLNEEKEE